MIIPFGVTAQESRESLSCVAFVSMQERTGRGDAVAAGGVTGEQSAFSSVCWNKKLGEVDFPLPFPSPFHFSLFHMC